VFLDGEKIDLLEVQGEKNDWTSWRVYWRKGAGAWNPADLKTPLGATSYANPTATRTTLPDGSPALLLTMFLPSEGNDPAEAGTLLWWRELPGS
jgi:hypothetical protein